MKERMKNKREITYGFEYPDLNDNVFFIQADFSNFDIEIMGEIFKDYLRTIKEGHEPNPNHGILIKMDAFFCNFNKENICMDFVLQMKEHSTF